MQKLFIKNKVKINSAARIDDVKITEKDLIR